MNKKALQEIISIADRLRTLAESMLGREDQPVVQSADKCCASCGKPFFDGERAVRGCHYSCYRALRRMELERLVSDDELVASGKWLPKEPGGRRKSKARSDQARAIKEAARLRVEKAKETSQSKATRGSKQQ
jgi:hypothetical protein